MKRGRERKRGRKRETERAREIYIIYIERGREDQGENETKQVGDEEREQEREQEREYILHIYI